MNVLKLATLAVLMIFGAAMAQDVEKKMEIKVMITGEGSDDATEMHWSSDDMDFDIQDLAVGETRTIESESGKTVTITRAEEGLSFDIEQRSRHEGTSSRGRNHRLRQTTGRFRQRQYPFGFDISGK